MIENRDEKEAHEQPRSTSTEPEQALAQQAQFIADLSHEMRGPLHAILGLTEVILNNDSLDGEVQRQLRSVDREAQALRLMLDELLDYSKISANHLELASEPFSPGSVLDAVGAAHGEAAREKFLAFRVSIDPSVPLVLIGDEFRLRQILVNLVSNAVKYTNQGSVELAARYRDGELRVSVSDTGPGIPEAAWPTLFEPYRQARQSDASKGTGLGLVITKRLVELMTGQLRFDTGAAGTRFEADIPLPEGRRRSDRQSVLGIPEASAARGLEVLVVDDTEVNRMLATSQLERLGHHPTAVDSGAAALELLTRAAFDLILMDWHMPHMDGLEATQRIRRAAEPNQRVPIIATTASAMAGDRDTCLEAGMDDYLAKPVSLSDLARMIERWAPTDPRTIPAESSNTDGIDALLDELGDVDIVKAVLGTFLAELPRWREDLEIGVSTGDFSRARRAAHSLKSTALMLGAAELSSHCATFESAPQTLDSLTQLLPDLVDQIDLATERFHTMQQELSPNHTEAELA